MVLCQIWMRENVIVGHQLWRIVQYSFIWKHEFLAEHLIHWGCANIYEVFCFVFMLHNADPPCAFEVFIQYFSLCCFIVFNRPFPIQSTASLNDISFITITAILMQSRYNNWGQSLGVSTYLTVMLFFFVWTFVMYIVV